MDAILASMVIFYETKGLNGCMYKENVIQFIDENRQAMLDLWERLVNMESGPDDKEGVDAIIEVAQEILEEEGFTCRITAYENAGNTLVAEFGGDSKQKKIGFIGHVDTVFPKGFLKEHPFKIMDGKAYGPGVLDMKGGIVSLLYVVKALRSIEYRQHPLKVIIVGDEETAHVNSTCRELLLHEFQDCFVAFNAETSNLEHHLSIGRQGGSAYELEVWGVASHTGIAWEEGRNAIIELAHKMLAINDCSRFEEGYTYNVTMVNGGTAMNTCPDYAKATIGTRCETIAQQQAMHAQLENIAAKTHIEGTHTKLTYLGGFDPMEVLPETEKLFDTIRKSAIELNLPEPTPIFSKGASDSAYSVLAGVPTVCSLGPQGEGNHTPEEYAIVESLFERTKLIVTTVLNLE